MDKLLLSACLFGQPVRYDGASKKQRNPRLERLINNNQVVAFCPETAGGLPVPRAAAEIQGGQGSEVLDGNTRVLTFGGDDVSDEFVSGAEQALTVCQKNSISIAILTDKSPSCGSSQTYDGSFSGTLAANDGVTSALLKRHGIRVFSQHQINDAIDLFESENNSHDR